MNATHQVQTDSPQRISLESHLVSATWKGGAAYGNCDAMLEVITTFVCEGAKVKIKCKTEGGKNLTNVDTQIYGNNLMAAIPIPERVPLGDLAYCIVKLPQHGLEIESNRIPTRPPILIESMRWSAQEAHRGDQLRLTTRFVSEIPDGTDALVIIYEYDQNGKHDPVVKIPATVTNRAVEIQWEFEYYGDTSQIPTEAEMQQHGGHYQIPQYFFVVVVDGVKIGVGQESGLLRFKDIISVSLIDDAGLVVKNIQYKLIFADSSEREGKLDNSGKLHENNIPPGKVKISFIDIDNSLINLISENGQGLEKRLENTFMSSGKSISCEVEGFPYSY
jgi:hypothetical protein